MEFLDHMSPSTLVAILQDLDATEPPISEKFSGLKEAAWVLLVEHVGKEAAFRLRFPSPSTGN